MKKLLTKIKKNNNKVQFLSYDNWGQRVALTNCFCHIFDLRDL